MLFDREKNMWEQYRFNLRSNYDLKLLVNQIIYVEGTYNEGINQILNERYSKITTALKQSALSADFLYMPILTKQINQHGSSFGDIVNYYFPNINPENASFVVSKIANTGRISRILIPYQKEIQPGFFAI